MCTYTYINISDLQIPISNSINFYWLEHGEEILSFPRDRQWTTYPAEVHSSLMPMKAYSCEKASLLAQENHSKGWSFRCYHGNKQWTCWEINPRIWFKWPVKRPSTPRSLLTANPSTLDFALFPSSQQPREIRIVAVCRVGKREKCREGKREKCTNCSSHSSATINIQ